jgi:Virulence-associated protein E-like domain
MPRARPPKPETYNANLAALPVALAPRTQQCRWVTWKWVWLPDRKQWTKPPFRADDPTTPAKSNDPSTWGSYADAVAAVGAGKADGIGYMLADDDLGAVDLDHCRDPETELIANWAGQEIGRAGEAYVEITVSGKGLRILGIGNGAELGRKWKIPDMTNGAAIEVYRRTNRYVTISGNQLLGGDKLTYIDSVLDDITQRFDGQKPKSESQHDDHVQDHVGDGHGHDGHVGHSDDIELLIRNGAPQGRRSEAFSRVVWSLASGGHGLDEIRDKLAAYPNGIASKYAGRLDREVERCFRKWQIKNPRSATSETPEWPDVAIDKDKGEERPKKTYRNARVAIRALGVICSYDEFHDRMLVAGHQINQWAGELSDAVNVVLRQIIVEHFDFDPGKENVSDAATELCLENRFDPIVDYLDGLDWDGTERLDTWLITYLGAADTPLNRAFSKLTLVAAVRRARKPGCKFDHILVLEGPEGKMKSTAIVVLAGIENFSDQTILTASDKEQQELVRGVWIFEIADLAGMKRSEVEKVKAFASRTHDRARPAYGRRRIDAPRRGILVGTTNEDEYLQSQTGNRRFWPAETGTIDIEGLRRDRDQLWAEAAEVEATGIELVLPKELWGDATTAQDERRQHDPWDDILANTKGETHATKDNLAQQEWVKLTEILFRLDIKPDRASPETYKRLKKVMKRLGWTKGKFYFGAGEQERGYWRPYPRQ